MAARRKKRSKTQMRTAREFDCKGCGIPLKAIPTRVTNPFDPDRKPIVQLRSPPRVVLTFVFSGYTPQRPALEIALCDACQARLTFTSAGVPLMITPDTPNEELESARGKLALIKREMQHLLSLYLEDVK
jgi:hypothetical protein